MLCARRFAIAAALLCMARAPVGAQLCAGDCSNDGAVAINELISCVTVALGTAAVSVCPACDADADGTVAINELVGAVTHALLGCPTPAMPTPTPTPLLVPTPTETRTLTPTVAATPMSSPTATGTATIAPTPTTSARPTGSATATRTATTTRTATAVQSGTPGTVRGRFREVAVSAQAATRTALLTLDWFALLDEAMRVSAGDSLGPPGCPGAMSTSCDASSGNSVQIVEYTNCSTATLGGHQVQRNGRVSRTVNNPHFCQDGVVGTTDVETLQLEAYEQTETAGTDVLAQLAATLTVTRSGAGEAGCAGPDVQEVFDGTVQVRCDAAAESLQCPRRGADVQLDPAALRRHRRSLDDPCRLTATIDGTMQVSNDVTSEVFTQIFDALQLEKRDLPEGARAVTMNGQFRADCLGAVTVSTDDPMVIAAETACPLSGTLSIARPGPTMTPAALASAGRESLRPAGAAAPPTPSGFRQRLYRAAHGQVYQVLQYAADEADNGAEALQLTSIVGSLGDGVAACVNTTGATSLPTAVTAAPSGQAFPLDGVFTSGLIAASDPPCFNRNGAGGNGALCIGADCGADCSCPEGAACALFTLGTGESPDAIPIGAGDSGLPPAALARLAAPSPPCDGFAGRAAYRFGDSGPTTERALCSAPPADGFALASGQSVVFAYQTQALEVFNAGAAGLLIDRDGVEPFNCPATDAVLSPGRATADTAAAARAEFVQGDVELHYADRRDPAAAPDRRFAACDDGARLVCDAPPLPTSTPDPTRPCGALVLESSPELSAHGSTAGHGDAVNGASCGWGGGNGTPDMVYEYVAPETGTYDVDLTDADFEAYLYARTDSCLSGQAELGCTDQANGSRDRHLALQLGKDQRVAIVVDGTSEQGGDFTLRMQCKPDLVVDALSVPDVANATGQIVVSAEILNQGGCSAGPFAVDVLYAADAAGTLPLSLVPVRCLFDGLPAGQRAVCSPASGVPVPAAAPGSYFVVARADAEDAVAERDEHNNLASAPADIAPSPGATLAQRIYRADDGTIYQLIEAVPELAPTVASGFRVTTVAVSSLSTFACKTDGTLPGTPLRAAAASADLLDLTQIRRTGILHPNDFGTALFRAGNSGRLMLGAGSQTIEVCAGSGDCGTDPAAMVPLSTAGGGLSAACIATAPGGSYCASTTAPDAFAFGLPQTGGVCSSSAPGQVGTESQLCAATQSVPGGFTLAAGEAVVFVSQPGRQAVQLGVGALGIARLGGSACAPNQFASAEALSQDSGALSLLSPVEVLRPTATTAIEVSPDGRHVYAAGDGALTVLARAEDGRLAPIQTETGLGDSVGSVTVSPDGKTVYVTDGVISVFARQAATGRVELTYRNGLGSGDGSLFLYFATLSPDARNLYASGVDTNVGHALAIFAREPSTGALVRSSILGDADLHLDSGSPGVVAVSPDGRFVDFDALRLPSAASLGARLVSGSEIETTASLRRDAATGALQLNSVLDHGTVRIQLLKPGALSIAPTSDGRYLYVASLYDAVTVMARDAGSGALNIVETQSNGNDGVDGLAGVRSIRLSPDGRNVYAAGATDRAVAIFTRQAETGRLEFVAAEREGLQDLGDVGPIASSPDGQYLYAAVGPKVAVFARQADTGELQYLDAAEKLAGSDGLLAPQAVALSPDGQYLYVAGSRSADGVFIDGTLAVFARDAVTGTLRYVELQRDGTGGVDGLIGASAVVVSPDGRHVYVTSATRDSIAVFSRDAATGTLHFVEVKRDGTGGVDGIRGAGALAVSADGRHVYVAGASDDAIAVFARQSSTGQLTFVEAEKRGLDGPQAVIVSPDGEDVYVASRLNDKIVAFARDSTTGALAFVEAEGRGLSRPHSLAISADGQQVYAENPFEQGLQVFERAPNGALRFNQTVPGIFGDGALLAVSGHSVYAVTNSSVALFARSAATDDLTLVETGALGIGLNLASLAVSPDGQHLYTASTSAGVAVFRSAAQ